MVSTSVTVVAFRVLRAAMAMRWAREAVSMTHRPAAFTAAMTPRRHHVRMVAAVTLAWSAAAVVFIGSPSVADTPNYAPPCSKVQGG
jgi:hypothetical protein